MKYAVDRSLAGKKYETADVGESLARVMKYWRTVRGKLERVHPDLRNIGVQRIEVNRDGLVQMMVSRRSSGKQGKNLEECRNFFVNDENCLIIIDFQ